MPNFKNDPIESKTETTARAISGISDNKSNEAGPGVYGESLATGVWGNSKTWMGVFGESKSTTGGAGVMGQGNPGPGVIGTSTEWIGVYGETAGMKNGPAGVWGEHKGAGIGVKAVSKDGAGLVAHSITNEAIHAETHSPKAAAVAAYNLNSNNEGFAILERKKVVVDLLDFLMAMFGCLRNLLLAMILYSPTLTAQKTSMWLVRLKWNLER